MQDYHIDLCKAHIEELLGWGTSSEWTSQDFDELSVRIQDTTGQVISSTTLKRIWGRVVYDSKPSRHSLDALASFLEYDSWRAFIMTHPENAEIGPQSSVSSSPAVQSGRRTLSISIGVLSLFMLILGAGLVLWLGLRISTEEQPDPNRTIAFTSRPTAFDLPNTVIFEYDVSGIQADSFFIQQSWDSRLRQPVSPSNSVHSSTYFYPGYFSAKLIADGDVLMEHPVHIKTPEWKVLIEEYPLPVYLPEEAIENDGALAVSREWLENAGYPLDSGNFVLGYYLVQEFGALHMDNFSMEAVVMHIKSEPRRPCQGGQITIRGEYGVIRFPFDIPGCTGLMHVIAGDKHLTGESNDLSSLGADYANWQHITLDVEEKDVRIQVGTNPPLHVVYTDDLGKVVGVWFQFVGRGMIDEIRFNDPNGRKIYHELF